MSNRIKYSIIMPYHNRPGQLFNTFMSFSHHYNDREDFEIILVEDIKNKNDQEWHDALVDIIEKFQYSFNIKLIESIVDNCYNPSKLFNIGVEASTGEYIILTNPECFHHSNILNGLDGIEKLKESYIVCSCLNIHKYKLFSDNFESFQCEAHSWYQHSKHRNAMFHFCSCISKENYLKIGGFDERFSDGYCYDDDDLRETIKRNNIPFIIKDDLLTFHQAHEAAARNVPNIEKLLKRNKALYFLKLQHKPDEEINKFLEDF